MSIMATRGKGSILQAMSDDVVWRRLEAARENLAALENFKAEEPAKLVGWRNELRHMEELLVRSETREREILSETQPSLARAPGVLGKVIAFASGEKDPKVDATTDRLGRLREGRARLQQEIVHAVSRIADLERKWDAETRDLISANAPKAEAARSRVAELEEAVRLLVRPTPENRATAYDLARTDFERALRDRVMKATSVRPQGRSDVMSESHPMVARA